MTEGFEKRTVHRLQTVHASSESARKIGEGDYGMVERAHIVTELQRLNDAGEWKVESAHLHPDEFVIKTFHRKDAVEDARFSVDCYNRFKEAGVTHIPGTHRISDSDPRVVISTLLGKGNLLVTRNSVPEEDKRPTEIDQDRFGEMLGAMTEELMRMSAHHITIPHEDTIFFELVMSGEKATDVNFVFGDFDTVSIPQPGDPKGTEIAYDESFRNNVTTATRAFFWLMLSLRRVPSIYPNNENLTPLAERIQLWAESHGLDAQDTYDEYIDELQAIIDAEKTTNT